jgi:hypothetical protein
MDNELRDLERKALSGDLDAKVRLIRKRFSLGHLDPKNLFLTPYPKDNPALGYPCEYSPYHGRWMPDGGVHHLLSEEVVSLVFSERVTQDYTSDSYIFDGAVEIHNPMTLQTLGRENLFDEVNYDKEDILESEEEINFRPQEIVVGLKLPGEPFQTLEIYSIFENIQMLANHPPEGLNPMEFYRPGYDPGNPTGYVDAEKLFGDVFMFVSDSPMKKKPNFNIIRPAIKDLARSSNIPSDFFKPQVQTIFGPAVIAKFRSDWSDLNFDLLPWPWNEYARESVEDGGGYPSALELEGLNAHEIKILKKFVGAGRIL